MIYSKQTATFVRWSSAWVMLAGLFLCTVTAAQQQAAPVSSAKVPQLVASFSILADMLRALAPADFQVSVLVGPNSDAHTFEPSPADGKRLAQADLVVVNGLGFEGWLDRLIKVAAYKGPLLVASNGIKPLAAQGHAQHAHAKDAPDPHAWQDLKNARQYVLNISQALQNRWPERNAEITARRQTYLAQIDHLDQKLRSQLEKIPRQQRRVLTSHDAFTYLGAAYDIEFLAPQGWATHSEPSAAAVARLIRQIRQQKVQAVFIENITDPRLMERIAQESGVKVGGVLYSDALSNASGPAATYLRMFEHNVSSILQRLPQ